MDFNGSGKSAWHLAHESCGQKKSPESADLAQCAGAEQLSGSRPQRPPSFVRDSAHSAHSAHSADRLGGPVPFQHHRCRSGESVSIALLHSSLFLVHGFSSRSSCRKIKQLASLRPVQFDRISQSDARATERQAASFRRTLLAPAAARLLALSTLRAQTASCDDSETFLQVIRCCSCEARGGGADLASGQLAA